MLMTLRMRLPVWPFHSPLRMRLAKAVARAGLRCAVPDACGEGGDLVEDGVDARHDVLAIDRDGGAVRRTQRDVQDRAILRDVALLAAKHGVDSLAHPGLLGQRHE